MLRPATVLINGFSGLGMPLAAAAASLRIVVGTAGNPAFESERLVTRLDARAEWPVTSRLSAVGSRQNLLQKSHLEFTSRATGSQATFVPRSGGVRMVWRF